MSPRIHILSLLALVAGAVLVVPASAQTTWYVDDNAPADPGPGDPTVSDPNEDGSSAHPFDAIQEGIDATIGGDTVLVLDGTYAGTGNKDLDFGGKDITVQSDNGPASCTIDCEGNGRGFEFQSGETASATVDGFTITGGGVWDGAGIHCRNASDPTIMNCIITGCAANDDGGGVYCDSSSPAIVNCIISASSANDNGGGFLLITSTAIITNCTIAGNDASKGGGGYVQATSDVTITNCIFSDNTASEGPEICLAGSTNPSTLTVSYTDVDGGQAEVYVVNGCTLNWGDGNIDADPVFADPNNADYHLDPGSLCIDAGTNTPPGGLPADDFEGTPRPVDGDDNVEPWTGQAETADMGADEREAPTTPIICLSPTAFEFVAPEGGPDPNDQTLSIRNCGIDTLSWQTVESCSWLSVDPNSGQSTGETDDVTLSVSVAGLSTGSYVCTLDVVDPNAPNSPQTVDVTLHVCPLSAGISYVDDDAPPGGDGTTWGTAYIYLQDALYISATGPCAVGEIRVAGGTYRPDQDEGGNVTPGSPVETFQLANEVVIAGGYRGLAGGGDPMVQVSASSPAARRFETARSATTTLAWGQ